MSNPTIRFFDEDLEVTPGVIVTAQVATFFQRNYEDPKTTAVILNSGIALAVLMEFEQFDSAYLSGTVSIHCLMTVIK